MLASHPRQVIAHGQASLSAAYDDGINPLGHGIAPKRKR